MKTSASQQSDHGRSIGVAVSLVIFTIALTINFIGDLLGEKIIDYITKPLIVPALIAFVAFSNLHRKMLKPCGVFIGGLVAAWAGDVALMFESDAAFIVGMAAFFIMHILYTIAFWWLFQRSLAWFYFIAALVYISLGSAFALYLLRFLSGALQYAVPVYILSVVAMSIAASSLRWWGMAGAALFALSDAAIATNKFAEPDWLPEEHYVEAFVIATYGIAQLLLCVGFVKYKHVANAETSYVNMSAL